MPPKKYEDNQNPSRDINVTQPFSRQSPKKTATFIGKDGKEVTYDPNLVDEILEFSIKAQEKNLAKTAKLFNTLKDRDIGEVDYREDYSSQDRAKVRRENRLIDVSSLNIKGRNGEQIVAYKLYQDNILAAGETLITVQTDAENVYSLSPSNTKELNVAFEALEQVVRKSDGRVSFALNPNVKEFSSADEEETISPNLVEASFPPKAPTEKTPTEKKAAATAPTTTAAVTSNSVNLPPEEKAPPQKIQQQKPEPVIATKPINDAKKEKTSFFNKLLGFFRPKNKVAPITSSGQESSIKDRPNAFTIIRDATNLSNTQATQQNKDTIIRDKNLEFALNGALAFASAKPPFTIDASNCEAVKTVLKYIIETDKNHAKDKDGGGGINSKAAANSLNTKANIAEIKKTLGAMGVQNDANAKGVEFAKFAKVFKEQFEGAEKTRGSKAAKLSSCNEQDLARITSGKYKTFEMDL